MRLSNEEIALMVKIEKSIPSRWTKIFTVFGVLFSLGFCVYIFNDIFHELSDGTEVLNSNCLLLFFLFINAITLISNSGNSSNDKLLVALARRINEIPEKETSQSGHSSDVASAPSDDA
jgi:hypothetical protein